MGDWSNGLFGCFGNCGLCLLSYFLPCVVVGQNAEKAGKGSCCLCGLAMFVPVFNCYLLASTRRDTREKHNIDGSYCGDCLVTWFCPFCSIIQVSRELDQTSMGQSMVRV